MSLSDKKVNELANLPLSPGDSSFSVSDVVALARLVPPTAPKLTEAQRAGLRMYADGYYASLCIMNGKLAAQHQLR